MDPGDGLDAFTFVFDGRLDQFRPRRRLKQEVMDVFMDELAFVDVAVAEPYVDTIESRDMPQDLETHLFAYLAHCGLAVSLALADMALGERPLAVGVHHHREIHRTALTLKHESPGGHFSPMAFAPPASFARGD